MNLLTSVLNHSPQQIPACHLQRAQRLHHQLISGTPYTRLGGKRIKHCPSLIRFKIGRNWRLLYRSVGKRLEPDCLIPRQSFEQVLKRR